MISKTIHLYLVFKMQYNKEYDLLNLTTKASQERRDVKPKLHVSSMKDDDIYRRGDILDANGVDRLVKTRCNDIYNYFLNRVKQYPADVQLSILEEIQKEADKIEAELKELDKEIHDKGTIEDIIKDMDVAWIPSNYYADEEDIYCKKLDGNVYPINHPDLSTQPSILPQRFGKKPIKEVLIGNTSGTSTVTSDPNIIQKDAIVIEASVFNDTDCVPAKTHKFDDGTITITNDSDIIPTFALIRYICPSNDNPYYYEG